MNKFCHYSSKEADEKCKNRKKQKEMSTSSNKFFGTPPEEIADFAAASDNLSKGELQKIMDEPFELEEIPISPDQLNFNMLMSSQHQQSSKCQTFLKEDSSKFQKKMWKKHS